MVEHTVSRLELNLDVEKSFRELGNGPVAAARRRSIHSRAICAATGAFAIDAIELALAAVLLIGVSSYSLPARHPAPLRLPVAINADLFDP